MQVPAGTAHPKYGDITTATTAKPDPRRHHGIQALDRVGRKAMMHAGGALKRMMAKIARLHPEAGADEWCKPVVGNWPRGEAATTPPAMGQAKAAGECASAGNASTTDGVVPRHGWIWLQIVDHAQRQFPNATGDDRDFYAGKLRRPILSPPNCRWSKRRATRARRGAERVDMRPKF